MQSKWNAQSAATFESLLAQRVYSSRLLGSDAALVLHGGGNTSVKISEPDVYGTSREILYVKGSGADLAVIGESGFTPLLLEPVRRLATLDALADPDMVRELASHCIRPGAPAASIEAILHAIIPHRFVDHTHADAILSITNTANGAARIAECFGDDVLVIPYVMPGFALARTCAKEFSNVSSKTIGIILLHHGIFSFGDSAQESYERMIALVDRAEKYLARNDAWNIPLNSAPDAARVDTTAIAMLRNEISQWARTPMILRTYNDGRSRGFANHPDVASLSQRGTATPDHVIRTKRVPMLGRNVLEFVARYNQYFDRNASASPEQLAMLDPAPRVVLDPEFGLCTAGRSAREVNIVGDIYLHTIDVILQATVLGGFQPLSERELFEIEYWDLEQAKLRAGGAPRAFAGEVALVTGAASGIGNACVDALLARGAAVAGIDINPEIETQRTREDFIGITCDVTDEENISRAVEEIVKRFGGIDIVICNAGIFPASKSIDALTNKSWRDTMCINTDASLTVLRAAHPFLKLAPRYGRVVIVGSRNVPAPGPGAAAYSASKAALTQLARVAALEWGNEGIRVNVVHPHGVFDTAIWKNGVIEDRAKRYGVSVEEYKSRNVLGVEIESRDVAELIAEMCGATFSKITGAQIPIDGGNERVI